MALGKDVNQYLSKGAEEQDVGLLFVDLGERVSSPFRIVLKKSGPGYRSLTYVFAHEIGHFFQRFSPEDLLLRKGVAASQKSAIMKIFMTQFFGPKTLTRKGHRRIIAYKSECWDIARDLLTLLGIPRGREFQNIRRASLATYRRHKRD